MNVAVNARELVGFPLLAVGYSFPEGDTPDARPLQNEFERILQSVATHLERTSLVPALRGLDRPGYSVMSDAPDINLTEMVGPDAQAAAVVNTIAARPELAEAVAIQLRTVLSRPELESLRSRLLANSNLSGEAVAGPVSVNLVNEAFGLNQLLPALLWLSAAPPGGIIGIEEPEIHLHPRSQVQLCDLLLAVAKEQRKQVVLTTHSEHVLIGFLTAIAEDRLSPEDLSVYEFRAHGATAKAQLLEVNEYGQITGGLRGFMEVDMENIAQLIEAMFRQGDE